MADKDKRTYVKETFNSIAGRYDFMNSLMSLGMDKRWRKKTVEIADIKPGMNILDVCCGTGKLLIEISKVIGSSGSATGIDFSERMLETAKKNIGLPEASNITLIQGDAADIPFDDAVFDGCTVGWGLRNVPDTRQVIREMMRVVKPKSMIVSIDMGKPELPIFKQIYWFYFEKLIPFFGKLFAGAPKEYSYLYNSAKKFSSQSELRDIFSECGLKNCGYKNLFGGVVAIVYGEKSNLP